MDKDMPTYLIMYELHAESAYSAFVDNVKQITGEKEPLWLFTRSLIVRVENLNSYDIRLALTSKLQKGDRVLITQISDDISTYGISYEDVSPYFHSILW